MSKSISLSRINLDAILARLQKFGAVLLVAIIALAGYYAAHHLLPGGGHTDPEHQSETVGETASLEQAVTLSDEKLAVAEITTTLVERRDVQPSMRVPGSIQFDAANKVDLRASTESVVSQVLIKPRQAVLAGDKLLVLTAPEVGRARVAIERAEAQLKLAENDYEWAETTNENLLELVSQLAQHPTVEQVSDSFTDKTLGEHRDEIISAYSQLLLAKNSFERGSSAATDGIIAGKILAERRSSLEVANAKFTGMVEQSKFQSQQDLVKAKAIVNAAASELEICRENLGTLIGPCAKQLAAPEPEQVSSRKNLGEYVLLAPRDGQIVQLNASTSSRFAQGEVMLVIAETSRVWVEAQIPQRDWQSIDLSTCRQVIVSVPGVQEQTFDATVCFSDSAVSESTMAVPLVAEMANTDAIFRPGMFVWVSVPVGGSRNAIAIPVGAIQRDGNDTMVFVRESTSSFRRVDVETGAESEGWVEIKSGLKQGDQVVDSGAFYLKSELLLEAD